MKSKLFLVFIILGLSSFTQSQTTYIPDPNFEQALINLGFDNVIDHYVLTANINTLTNLDVDSKNIGDLTGIEAFAALEMLSCRSNKLSSLNIWNNIALKYLHCDDNLLTNLDVTHNTLHGLDCGNNLLTWINVSNSPNLTYLTCSHNNLTSLDLSENPLLTFLQCSWNQIASLDVSKNTILDDFQCHYNQLVKLDLTKNTQLKRLFCNGNQLTNLDVSNNPSLELLWCHENQIKILDVSINIALKDLSCRSNNLTRLNIKNGHNTSFVNFVAVNNPNLTCIQVDNAAWANANLLQKDATATYSEECNSGNKTYIPDQNFEQALKDLGYDNVIDHYVITDNINTITSLNVRNKNISDLTGIEAFIALEILTCGGNQLTSLNVASNTELIHLECSQNKIVTLDLSNNLKLIEVGCVLNQLTNLNPGNNSALKNLMCQYNQLTSLNVTNNQGMELLTCYNNQLASLDVTSNTALQNLGCFNNQLTSLNLSSNPALNTLSCANNKLTTLNVKNGHNTSFILFMANNNPNLTCIQVDNAAWSNSNWPNKDATASYANDCGNVIQDSDGDGVSDDMDDYPNDAMRAFDNYFPAAGFGSLGFEDLWPNKGDYDFNDVVVDYRFKTVTDALNNVVESKTTFVLKASGAYFHNGFGFNLPDASALLLSNSDKLNVSGYDIRGSYILLKSNGIENGQSKPTIIVFDDIFNSMPDPGQGLGVNTTMESPFVPYDTITIIMNTGTTKLAPSDFSFETWNPFIIVNKQRGIEVHLPNHPPTDLADQSVFGTNEDKSDPSTGKFYKTVNNLPWAIDVVSEFDWPIEKTSISDAYLHFVDWAASSGAIYNDWYSKNSGYRNNSNIYVKH